MPVLQNPRHEAFARARAGGARLEEAYAAAGLAAGQGHASRLANSSGVARRIRELREEEWSYDPAQPAAIIDALMKMAAYGQNTNLEWHMEARRALVDASRIRSEWMKARPGDFPPSVRPTEPKAANDSDLKQEVNGSE